MRKTLHTIKDRYNDNMGIGFDSIISELNISYATLQNWLKTNCLISTKNGFVTEESYNYFKKNILGKHKLNKRANKQHLNNVGVDFDIERNNIFELSSKYEQSLSLADRNKKGIYYTPDYIIDEMFLAMQNIAENDSFLDPCCGSGNFLIKALEKGFKPENIYGFDVDETALKIANKRFYQASAEQSNNIKNLSLLEKEHKQKYNFIFTNPPWGYKFNVKQKIFYADNFNNGIKVDSAALFVLLCLQLLPKDGCLGVLLPDAFFNISAFKSVRVKLLKKTLIKLINHGKPFDSLQSKAYSLIIKNNDNYTDTVCQILNKQHIRKQQDFIDNPNHIINFDVLPSEARVISYLYSYPHQTLANKAKWGLGIVTGNNTKHLKQKRAKGYKAIYKGKDIKKGKINHAKYYILDDFSKLQQTASKKLYLANKKIVYRFINSNLIFALDNKQRYFLNSANFFILNKHILFAEDALQITEEQLVFLMNSNIMNWLFKKLFNTHKILRSDLEKLPIFVDFFTQNKQYTEEKLYKYLNIEENNGTFRIKK